MIVTLTDNFHIEKYGLSLRLVNKEDASFIYLLRSNQLRNKHVHTIGADVNAQIRWIEEYKDRELKGLEYYFIVSDVANKPYGTTRIYNFDKNSFETGSWVFLEDTPLGMAIIGDIMGREIAFDQLGFDFCKFEVRKDNKTVLQNYHLKYNPKIISEDNLNYYFELSKEQFNLKKKLFLKILGYDIK
jgi:hypothetical protein